MVGWGSISLTPRLTLGVLGFHSPPPEPLSGLDPAMEWEGSFNLAHGWEGLTLSPFSSLVPLRARQPSSSCHSPASLGPMPPPVSPGPQAVSWCLGAEAP